MDFNAYDHYGIEEETQFYARKPAAFGEHYMEQELPN
jgi:hypothetical protein